jgi:microcystin-dependent protein
MQTNNLSMQMLLQNQSSPDATINDNFLKIDSFIFGNAVDIIDSIPTNPQNGEVYIFSSKFEKANHIGFFTSNKGWKFFEPKLGWEFFVMSHRCKYSLTSEGWGISTADKQNADWNATSGSAQILNKPSLFSGSYADLTNKPVLFDGSYASLTNKPVIPNLPTLAAVATSGSYADLTNKPALFDGSYTSLKNKPTIPTALDSVYIGDFKQSLQSVNHEKWLLCNGQMVSRSTYSALFAIIGTAFGGDDSSTTFTLPDCRGRVNASIGQGVGLTNRTSGQTVGAEVHTLSVSEMPGHNHIDGFAGVNSAGSFGVSSVPVAGNINNQGGQTTVNHALTSSSGGGQAHNNMQPTIFLGNTFIYAGV